jgi:hypothetical protein
LQRVEQQTSPYACALVGAGNSEAGYERDGDRKVSGEPFADAGCRLLMLDLCGDERVTGSL